VEKGCNHGEHHDHGTGRMRGPSRIRVRGACWTSVPV
jgi:hypothetical protein